MIEEFLFTRFQFGKGELRKIAHNALIELPDAIGSEIGVEQTTADRFSSVLETGSRLFAVPFRIAVSMSSTVRILA
jgi:hypothetical protein